MTPAQLQILQHTIGTDEFGRRKTDRNHFVTDRTGKDGAVCESLVDLGLMTRREPNAISGGMHIYHATDEGYTAVSRESPKPPKVKRSQQRYLDYLREESGLKFGEWLKAQRHRRRDRMTA